MINTIKSSQNRRKIKKKELSFEERHFLSIAIYSIKIQDGHYELQLLFKRDDVSLPNNREVAEQRTLSHLRRGMLKRCLTISFTEGMEDCGISHTMGSIIHL